MRRDCASFAAGPPAFCAKRRWKTTGNLLWSTLNADDVEIFGGIDDLIGRRMNARNACLGASGRAPPAAARERAEAAQAARSTCWSGSCAAAFGTRRVTQQPRKTRAIAAAKMTHSAASTTMSSTSSPPRQIPHREGCACGHRKRRDSMSHGGGAMTQAGRARAAQWAGGRGASRRRCRASDWTALVGSANCPAVPGRAGRAVKIPAVAKGVPLTLQGREFLSAC